MRKSTKKNRVFSLIPFSIFTLEKSLSNKKSILDSGVISVLNACSFVAAFLADILVATQYGLDAKADIFFLALTIPLFIYSVTLIAFNMVLVPIFTDVHNQQGINSVSYLASNWINLSFVGFSALGLAGYWGAAIIVKAIAPGFDTVSQRLATELTASLFLMVIPMGATEVIRASLNSLRMFFLTEVSLVLRNLGIFFAILIIHKHFGIHSLVYAYIAGTWLQFIFLTIIYFIWFKYRFVLNLYDRFTAIAGRRLGYTLLSFGSGQSFQIFERALATFLPVGSIAALAYARRILRAIDSILLGSAPKAYLPQLSLQFATGKFSEFSSTLVAMIKYMISIGLFIAALCLIFSEQAIALLFQRGSFDAEATRLTASMFRILVATVPALALFQALSIAYFASGDTKTPLLLQILNLLLHIGLIYLLLPFFGGYGLPLAFAVTRYILAAVTLFFANRRFTVLYSDLQKIYSNG